ncbi:hypothetical protein [Methylophaga sp.]|uniref:hypothetical protein n=1 Tax=Methylophaga sp. TaxID=2024840 RepID=UPI003F6A339C
MEIVLTFMLLALIYALFKSKKLTAKPFETTTRYNPYAAVKIEACEFSCNASFDRSSQVFLAREAPSLPLNDCDTTAGCSCKYIHFEDRRHSQEDRRSGSQVLQNVFDGKDHRGVNKRGRRASDFEPSMG